MSDVTKSNGGGSIADRRIDPSCGLVRTEILVVDEGPQNLRALDQVIESLGANAIAIASPEDALAHPKRLRCGFVLALRPEFRGVELLAHLRADGVNGPALLVMRRRRSEIVSEAAAYGAACCVERSIHCLGAIRSLVDTVRHGMTRPGDVLAWLVLTLRLTPTERRTVGVYLEGICTREGVASALNRSQNTVKETTSHILAKATAVGLADDTVPALLLDAYRQVAGRMAGGTRM